MHLKQRTSWAFALIAPLALSSVARADYVAYDDTSAGSTITATAVGANVANITPTNTTTGSLLDYTTGTPFATLTFTVTAGSVTAFNNGTAALVSGTPAYDIFNGFVNVTGTYSGTSDRVIDMTFSGLDPTKTYEVALYGQRNTANAQSNIFTISDADDFTNASSGVGDPNSNTYSVAYANPNGYVAQWVDISPGADGDFVITLDGGTGGMYLSALRLIEIDGVPEPASLALLGIGSLIAFRRKP